jgi:hypothetical protein
MAVLHKFQNVDFRNGFQTRNSILEATQYDPEVIFIGTFNHGWTWNRADFFYGRDMYMWTILGNMFLNGRNVWRSTRSAPPLIPSLEQIFQICEKGKIAFADIIKGTKNTIPAVQNETNETVLVNDNYIWSTYQDSKLIHMAHQGWIDDNVQEIIDFIDRTKSIKHVYYTFKTGDWFIAKVLEINQHLRGGVSTGSIFTPSGNGFGPGLPRPFHRRAASIAHCWTWNGLPNPVPVNRLGYTHLDHTWLTLSGVNPQRF